MIPVAALMGEVKSKSMYSEGKMPKFGHRLAEIIQNIDDSTLTKWRCQAVGKPFCKLAQSEDKVVERRLGRPDETVFRGVTAFELLGEWTLNALV